MATKNMNKKLHFSLIDSTNYSPKKAGHTALRCQNVGKGKELEKTKSVFIAVNNKRFDLVRKERIVSVIKLVHDFSMTVKKQQMKKRLG